MKRTELKRTAFKRKPPKRVVSPKVAREVLDRAQDRCERCRGFGPLVLHHKLRRSQGGLHDATNLVALCSGPGTNACHEAVHDSPAQSIADGWLISPIERPR